MTPSIRRRSPPRDCRGWRGSENSAHVGAIGLALEPLAWQRARLGDGGVPVRGGGGLLPQVDGGVTDPSTFARGRRGPPQDGHRGRGRGSGSRRGGGRDKDRDSQRQRQRETETETERRLYVGDVVADTHAGRRGRGRGSGRGRGGRAPGGVTGGGCPPEVGDPGPCFFFCTLVTGPRRSLSL